MTIDGTTYKKLNSDYLSGLTAVTTGGVDSEVSCDELLTGTFSGRYYIVYVTEYNNNATIYGIQPYEFMAAYISETESNKLSSTFTMSDVEVVKGSEATVTVSLYTVGGDAANLSRVSDLTLTCGDDSAVTIAATETTGTYTVSASDYGIYTLTATATGDDDNKSTITGTCTLTSTFDWENNTNVACVINNSSAYAYTSSNTSTAQNAIDGNTGTSWQADYATGEYLYVDLGAQYTITAISQEWENAYATKYTYSYSNSIDDNGDLVWTDIATISKTLSSANHYDSPYDLTESVVAQYIKITANELAMNYGMNIYEFRVAGTYYGVSAIGTDNISTITLTLDDTEIYKGESTTLTVTATTKAGDAAELSKLSNFAFTDIEGVTITATETTGVYTVTTTDYGIFTITATANSDDVSSTALTGTCTLTSAFDWESNTNVALNKTAYASSNTSDAQNAIDGNTGTRWQANSTDSGEYLYVDLGAKYKITALTLVWEAAYATAYTYYYATETDTDGTPSWTRLADVTNNFTWDAGGYEEPYELESAVVAQYVKIEATSLALSYGVSFYEFRVAGTEYTTTVAVTPEFDGLLIGESVTLSSVVTDADGNTVENAEVTYTIDSTNYMTLSGSTLTAVAKGTTTVTATYNDTYTGTTTVTVAADPDNITATRYAVEADDYTGTYVAKNAIDGDYTTAWMTSDTDADVTHTLTLTLLPTYDVELVRIYWGTGNSCAYTLQTAAYNTTAENGDHVYTTVYTYSGEAEVAERTDRIFGIDMSGTDYIKLISTKNNAANSGLTIYEIECYGTKSNTQTSGISNITLDSEAAEDAPINVYSITGTLVRQGVEASEATDGLTPGFYIVGNKKVAVK